MLVGRPSQSWPTDAACPREIRTQVDTGAAVRLMCSGTTPQPLYADDPHAGHRVETGVLGVDGDVEGAHRRRDQRVKDLGLATLLASLGHDRRETRATSSSTGTAASASTSVRVRMRWARTDGSDATSTPIRSSATVMTETLPWAGSSARGRSCSRVTNTDVSRIPVRARRSLRRRRLAHQRRSLDRAGRLERCVRRPREKGAPSSTRHRHELGHGAPAHRHPHRRARFHLAQHGTDVVAQLPLGDLSLRSTATTM